MVLLKAEVKEEIMKELRKGTSINKISKLLSLGKSTIYYYYKKINGKKYVPPYVQPNFSEKEGEIVGIFTGDGSQYFAKGGHYQVNVHFGGHRKEYALYVQKLFSDYFCKKFQLSNLNDGKLRLRTNSKDIFHYFKNYIEYNSKEKHCTVNLKTLNIPMKFKVGFIKGLVDTDGSVLYDKHDDAVRIFYYTTSEKLAEQISSILRELSIKNTCICRTDKKGRKPLYVVRVLEKEVYKFLNIVKPFKQKLLKGPVVQW
ncbi:LAGLIDADG family homing endonuclease [Candidatus Woesearchaeota archaeon]|nr:LAGLIDADG family homing endonuclease [Candidatus Woesearchaeota archaeon]